jgi:hypothetical protein
MQPSIWKYLAILLLFLLAGCEQNILFFGAIPNEDSLHAQIVNAKAITDAIIKANSSESRGDARVVVIPLKKFYSMPIAINFCNDIVIELQGKLTACNRIKNWPRSTRSSNKYSY